MLFKPGPNGLVILLHPVDVGTRFLNSLLDFPLSGGQGFFILLGKSLNLENEIMRSANELMIFSALRQISGIKFPQGINRG